MKNEKNLIITGASGFLGSNLICELQGRDDVFIHAFSSKSVQNDENICYHDRNFAFTEQGRKLFSEAIVINCAFPRNTTGTQMADGLAYIRNLFEITAENHAKAVINISSQSVYSSVREVPASEDTPPCLDTTYAVGKYASELLLESICKNIPHTNIRLASLIGAGFNQRIVNKFIKQALEVNKLAVKENKKIFSFMDISDAVSGIIAMLDSDVSKWNPVYNLGTDNAYSLIDIAYTVSEVISEYENILINIETEHNEDVSNSSLCNDLFLSDFGFKAKTTLKQSVVKIYNAIKSGK